MNSPLVFILILNWNGWKDTIECLESVQKLTYPNYRIVVIDNGSKDCSLNKIKAWAAGELPVNSKIITFDPSIKPLHWVEYDRVTIDAGALPELEDRWIKNLPPNRRMILIQTGSNLGFAGGNNIGIRYALMCRAEYVWLLNNDTVVDCNALTEMVSVAEANKSVGFVGSKLLYYDKPDIIQAAGGGKFNFWTGLSRHYGWLEKDSEKWNQPFSPHYITGASLLVRQSCIIETGLLDESFFFYGEESDWQFRAYRHGWRTYYCPTSIIYHREGATAGYKSPIAEFYATRAGLRLCRRYAPWSLPTAVFFNTLRAIRRFVNGYPYRAIAVIRGILMGLCNQSGQVQY